MENFDCTQFITFSCQNEYMVLSDIVKIFTNIGFDVLLESDIRQVKKTFFQKCRGNILLELKDDNYLGYFYEWKEKDTPPKEIIEFQKVIVQLMTNYKLEKLKIIFSYFAQEGKSSLENIKVQKSEIMESLFYVSTNNYDVWADNYVIEII